MRIDRFYTRLALILFLMAVVTPLLSQNVRESPEKLYITGTLLRSNGSPASGEKVYIFPYKKNGDLVHVIGMRDDGYGVINPHGEVDADGRFVIEFTRQYFSEKGTEEFSVGQSTNTGPKLFGQEDPLPATAILGLDLFQRSNKLDLDEILGIITSSVEGQ